MTTVTLNLPDTLVQNMDSAAKVLHCSREEVLTSLLQNSLPQLDSVPTALQGELLKMTWLDDAALFDISQQMMSESAQSRLTELSSRTDNLTSEEQQDLQQLRQHYGAMTLRKARAYALLSARSGKLLLDNVRAA